VGVTSTPGVGSVFSMELPGYVPGTDTETGMAQHDAGDMP